MRGKDCASLDGAETLACGTSLDGAETPACEGLERIREETGKRNKYICIQKGTRNET